MKRYRDWKLTTKIVVPVGIALLVVSVGAGWFLYAQRMGQVQRQAAQMAPALAMQIAEDCTTTRTMGSKNPRRRSS